MSGCRTNADVGDTITWSSSGEVRHARITHIETGTAHMCLYVCDDDRASVWDWEVTHVNGVQIDKTTIQ